MRRTRVFGARQVSVKYTVYNVIEAVMFLNLSNLVDLGVLEAK